MARIILILAAMLWAGVARAADTPRYGPPPAWVKVAELPKVASPADAGALQLILQDQQIRMGPEGDHVYLDLAFKVLSPQALTSAGNVSSVWRPDIDEITVHRIEIIRDGKAIDALAGGRKLTVLRRETGLEMSMLDGSLTAHLQLEDLRVGDIVRMATSLVSRDPVLQGRSQAATLLVPAGRIGRFRFRALWDAGKPIRWRTTEGLGEPALVRSAAGAELTIDRSDALAPQPPKGAPSRFRLLGYAELSEFADWRDISALMAPHYAKASTLRPGSPILAEVAKIRAASPDPKARAEAALRLVQDQVRYLFLGMNFGGYIPAEADVTWSRRFGDCKGKTALLLAVLRELGIEAQAALVNSNGADGLDERLPLLTAFDHVIVRAVIGGKVYWLDGTRQGDLRLDWLQPPEVDWALPVSAPGAGLERIEQPPLDRPDHELTVRYDLSGGLDKPAPARLEWLYRGQRAIDANVGYAAMNQADVERSLRNFWAKSYPLVRPIKVGWTYDAAANVLRIWLEGVADLDWDESRGLKYLRLDESNLGWSASLRREPGPNQDAPYEISHPFYRNDVVRIVLPRGGSGFSLGGAPDLNRTVAGRAFYRRSRIERGEVIMEASFRSLQAEFPAAQAEAAEKDLREMNERNVLLWAPGVMRAEAEEPDPSAGADPADAAGYATRGLARLGAGDHAKAIADLSKALELEPQVARHAYNRGIAYFRSGSDRPALADFTRALALNPQYGLALMARAEVHLAMDDDARALADFEAAAALAPTDMRLLDRQAASLERAGRYPAALRLRDRIVAGLTDPRERAMALNNRCFLRARWGRELDKALEDCDAAVRALPGEAGLLDSRGLVRLRLGQFDAAIADYDAALQRDPNIPESLFGRGVARYRKGQRGPGMADMAAAAEARKDVAADFEKWGLRP